jgi:protein SCO1/2
MIRFVQTNGRCFLIAAAIAIITCHAKVSCNGGSASAGTNVTRYTVRGVFLESRSEGRVAVIAHEAVPGYMDPMTMPFNVKTPAELKGLQSGDRVTFQLSVTASDDWIDEIKKGKGHPKKAKRSEPATGIVHQLQLGESVPDFVLTNQAGQAIRLGDFKGQALAFTFFFSRCPLPTFCPRMNNNFELAQQALQTEPRTNWQLLSVSFDPSSDTPERLSDFATLHHSDPRHWSFATSSQEEIRKLGGAFGLKFWRESGSFSHNLRTVVVNGSGRVQKVLAGNEWQAADLVEEMRKAMTASETR